MMTGMVEREAQVWSKSFVSPRGGVCHLLAVGGHYGALTCANCQHGTLNLTKWVRDQLACQGFLSWPGDTEADIKYLNKQPTTCFSFHELTRER